MVVHSMASQPLLDRSDSSVPEPSAGTGPGGSDITVHNPVQIKLSFWQNKYVQDLLPFLTSITLHIPLIVIGVVGYAGYKVLRPVEREQVIIPDGELVDGAIGGVPNPGLGGDPNRPAAQDQVADAPTESAGWSNKTRQSLTNTLMGGGSGTSEDESVIAAGPGGIGKGKGAGAGSGDQAGGGSGDGVGQLAIFGVPGGGGGIGPVSKVFGRSGNAMRVAYVCDASGSMMSKFDDLRLELGKAVNGLAPIQSFNVILFSDGVAKSADDSSMLIANPDNKRKAMSFIHDFSPRSSSDPMPAINLAFRQHAQLIYLLTDGDFPEPDRLRKRIAELNVGKKVKINTIAFVSKPTDPAQDNSKEFVKYLRQLAVDNGGVFKYVTIE
jgi:hypothetical protein